MVFSKNGKAVVTETNAITVLEEVVPLVLMVSAGHFFCGLNILHIQLHSINDRLFTRVLRV